MISSFISSYSLNTLFTETNLSLPICQSIKVLKTKTSMLFNLVSADNYFLSCFFFLFLIIDVYFLIPAIIAEIFNSTAESPMSIGILTKEAKAEIKSHPLTAEAQISKC